MCLAEPVSTGNIVCLHLRFKSIIHFVRTFCSERRHSIPRLFFFAHVIVKSTNLLEYLLSDVREYSKGWLAQRKRLGRAVYKTKLSRFRPEQWEGTKDNEIVAGYNFTVKPSCYTYRGAILINTRSPRQNGDLTR